MGLGMSLNLQRYLQAKDLPPLRYSNRTISKGDVLRDAGAVPEEFYALVQKSDVIFTMVRAAIAQSLLNRLKNSV